MFREDRKLYFAVGSFIERFMPQCQDCGRPVGEGVLACPSCGNYISYTPSVTTTIPTPDMSQEKVMNVIVLRGFRIAGMNLQNFAIPRIKNRSESIADVLEYALVVTNQRCIFAQLTKQMLKEELDRKRQKAKEEGKGALRQWKASHPVNASTHHLCEHVQKYSNMKPEVILQETSGNYSIKNSNIDSIEIATRIWYHSTLGRESYRGVRDVELVINSKGKSGKYKVTSLTRRTDEMGKPYVPMGLNVLQEIFGQKIKIFRSISLDPNYRNDY